MVRVLNWLTRGDDEVHGGWRMGDVAPWCWIGLWVRLRAGGREDGEGRVGCRKAHG